MITVESLFKAKVVEAVEFLVQAVSDGAMSIKHPKLDIETFPRSSKRIGMANVIHFSDEHLNNHWYYIQVTKLIDGYYLENKELFNPRNMPDVSMVKKLFDAEEIIFDLKSKSSQVDGFIFSQTRPYHYFYDQFVNYFKLSSFKNIDKYCFRDETCFYSQTPSISFKPIVDPGCYFFPCTIPGNYHGESAKKMHSFLKHNTEKVHNKSELTIWLGITGQKRSWIEQVEGYVAIIQHLNNLYKDITIIVDGWTNFERDDSVNIEDHDVYKLIEQEFTAVKGVSFINLINKTYAFKIMYANSCDYFIANSGTGCMVPFMLSNIKGVIHGNGQLHTFKDSYNETIRVIPKEKVISESSSLIMNNSYSIRWEVIYNFLMDLMGRTDRLSEPKIEESSKITFSKLTFTNETQPADALRTIALAFEKVGDKETAYSLMCKALEQRPTGPVIKKKVNQLKAEIEQTTKNKEIQ